MPGPYVAAADIIPALQGATSGELATVRSTLGIQPSLIGRRMGIIGDSREAVFNVVGGADTRIQARNFLAWANAFLGGRMVYAQDCVWGYSGQGSAYWAAQYDAAVAANYANFDILAIEGPTNDLDYTSNIFAAGKTVENITTMARKALAAQKIVMLYQISPRALWNAMTSPQIVAAKKQMTAYNRWAAQFARENAGVIFINDWQDLADASGNPVSGVTYDDLHFGQPGALLRGRRTADTLRALLPDTPEAPAPVTDIYDATFSPRGNIVANSALTGSGGTKGAIGGGSSSLVAGTVPTNWDVSRGTGTSAGLTMSQEAATTGYNSQPSKMVATVAFASGGGATEAISINGSFTGTPAFTAGKKMQASCIVECASVARLKRFQFGLRLFGTTFQQWLTFEDGTGAILPLPDGTLLLQSPIATIAAGQAGGDIQFYFEFDAAGGNAGGTFKFWKPSAALLS